MNGNPLVFTDPTGEAAENVLGGVAGAGGLAGGGATTTILTIGSRVLIGGTLGALLTHNTVGNDDQFYPDPAICSQFSTATDKPCKLHSQNKIGLEPGKIRCTYICPLGSGGKGFITRITDGNSCPSEVDWVPGNHGF